MRMSKSGWQIGMIFGVLLTACGVQSRHSRGTTETEAGGTGLSGERSQKPNDQRGQEQTTSGVSWSIHEAQPQGGASPHSAWKMGAHVPYKPVIEGSRASIVDSLPWPDEPKSILAVQFRDLSSADWSVRCVRPDDSIEETLPTRRMDWSPEVQSGIIALSDVFGSRGERRDPATTCHLLVRFLNGGESRSLEISLRVNAGLPAPEPADRRDHELSAGGVIREESWVNSSFKDLRLKIEAKSTIEATTWLESQYFMDSPKERKTLSHPQTLHAVTGKTAIQARVLVDSNWSSWSSLPLVMQWAAGSILRVEYRLAAGAGTPVCSLDNRILQRVEHFKVTIFQSFRAISSHFQGSIDWKVSVQDPPRVHREGRARLSEAKELQEFLTPRPDISSSAFDCQGWVP